MFIRWKRRKKKPTKQWRRPRLHSECGDSLYCVLVESRRINGSPRQKVICYLGSIEEAHCQRVWDRVDFWNRVSSKLDALPLTRREMERIEKSIDRVVTKVPEEEAATFRKERAALLKTMTMTGRFQLSELLRLLGS
jgi:hypothetical protein